MGDCPGWWQVRGNLERVVTKSRERQESARPEAEHAVSRSER